MSDSHTWEELTLDVPQISHNHDNAFSLQLQNLETVRPEMSISVSASSLATEPALIVATYKDKPIQLIESLNLIVKNEASFGNLFLFADYSKGQAMVNVVSIRERGDMFRLKVQGLVSNREKLTIEYPMSYQLKFQGGQAGCGMVSYEDAARFEIVEDQVRTIY